MVRAAHFIIPALALGCVSSSGDQGSTSAAATAGASATAAWQEEFGEDPRSLQTTGRNDYFVLEPGYQLYLEGKDRGDKTLTLTITVLDEIRKIDGIETRVVEEREMRGTEPIEVSRNYFAISPRTKNVYYFGEEVDIYKDGRVVEHEGAWLHGEDGARFGMIMPGSQRIGQRYCQEIAPEVAMDRAETISTTETVEVRAGRFVNCLKVEETTPLEKDERAHKLYAPGVGLLRDGGLQLVRYGPAGTRP